MSFNFSLFSDETSWGPNSSTPSNFSEYTYSLFNKNEVVGKVADWNQKPKSSGTTSTGVVGYVHEEDDSSFNLVLSKRVQNPQKRGWKGALPKKKVLISPQVTQKKGGQRKTITKRNAINKEKNLVTKFSTVIKSDWKLEQTLTSQQMSKLKSKVPSVEDLKDCGSLMEYNTIIDQYSVKSPFTLEYTNKKTWSVTTSDDPVIKSLASEKTANVYATDSILSAIMASQKSVFSWDVLITNKDGVIYFDKREKSRLDVATVDENSKEPFADCDDTPSQLFQEASVVQKSFIQQCLTGKKLDFEAHPFKGENDNAAPVEYKYRKFTIGETSFVVRCEVDAYLHKEKQLSYTIRCFNEYNPGNLDDWRNNLYENAASVFMNEVKKNSNKATRWGIQGYLAGTDFMKIGFVSRTNGKIRNKHQILGTQLFSTEKYASQCVHLSFGNIWGIVMNLVEQVVALGSGKYLLVKEPGFGTALRLYSVPNDAVFQDEETDVEQSPIETRE